MNEHTLAQRFCTVCESIQLFEVPVCDDGHGPECPELVCVACGTALVIDVGGLGSGAGRSAGATHHVA